MNNTKYIIEYLAGCKGDMLATALLKEQSLIFDDLKRTVNRDSAMFVKDISAQLKYGQKIPTVDNFIKSLNNSSDRIITSHGLFFLEDQKYHNVLTQLNFKVKKIVFKKNHYQTIKIENLFKNLKSFSKEIEKSINFERNEDSYSIDYDLIKNSIPLTNSNRAEMLDKKLKNKMFLLERLFNSSKHCNHRELLDYQDLYIDFNLSDPFLESLNIELYKKIVDNSWLPEKINVFGEIWKPKEYGYRSF